MCLAGLAAAAIAVGLAALTAASSPPAHAQSCSSLQPQLASARRGSGNRAEYRRYADAARRQQRELTKAQRMYSRQGCRQSGSRQCRSLGSTINQMQANLMQLQRVRDRNRGGASRREVQRLERAVQRACRRREPTRTASVRRDTGTLTRARPNRSQAARPAPARPSQPSFAGEHRTLCVRTCDGYFFPISFATNTDNFERDKAICAALCPAAPTMLFTHRSGDDDGPQNMTALDGTPYTDLATAFDFRERKRSETCTCGRANTSLIGIEGVTPRPGEEPPAQAEEEPARVPPPRFRPDLAADPETRANTAQGLTVGRMTDIARSVSVGEIYDVAGSRDRIRVVGGEFLPDPEGAIDLTNPVPTPFP
ncbi:MAG: DUF2865 domain-containing protein [Roseitalea sp.]|jgi:hypothetical protein|nr:DUF2865 domain-containing protein [Roseitalea sp.]MBO6721779.1 DUF2865 domain-containing protein [Roseitalea sp.]MBO6741613.1 DUF2865 domain-containing protein [Roseitalea sp.]